MRVGFGIDVHRFGGEGPLVLGGVIIDTERGLQATSDGDVAIHALIDALLGAAALGDLGDHFPSGDPQWRDASSLDLLEITMQRLASVVETVVNVDLTVLAQSVRIAPHRAEMRATIAAGLGIEVGAVSLKATTTDHLGLIGRDEGVAALATVLVESGSDQPIA